MINNKDLHYQYTIFCDNVRYYRKLNQLTQEKLAELADISISYVKQIESSNEYKNISLTTILKISNNIPTKTPILYKIVIIFIFSFKLGFDLNNIKSATPLLVNKPDIVDPKGRRLFKYNSVIKMLEPQFGIKPISPLINGVNQLFFKKTCFK